MRNFKIIRQAISSRGGGIEIDLRPFGHEGEMTAYQNYLGGGMLGRVASDCNIANWRENDELARISLDLKKYLHSLTNPDDSEWEAMTLEQNQKLPVSSY